MEPIRGLEEINDPFYRYKMQRLDIKKERTKTVINNLANIASNLNIQPDILFMWIKTRLSTPLKKQDNKIIISNDLDIKELQTSIYEFIEYFILCPTCKLPETNLVNKKHVCKACGKTNDITVNKHTSKIIEKI